MFKVGDKIICINNSGHNDLILNKTYIFKCLEYDDDRLINIHGVNGPYHIERFILDVKQLRKEKLQKLCLK